MKSVLLRNSRSYEKPQKTAVFWLLPMASLR